MLWFPAAGHCAPPKNDHIFPSASEARSSIDFDSRGFLINGKRTFIVSAGVEYARIPRAQWRDRLLRLKRAGFNAVEIYTFWNFHEPEEGQFDFTGDHDLDAFLKLVKQMGMFTIARVGPYYCAEWDSGGYPIWLRFKPGLVVRQPNEEFEMYVDRFFDRLLPIIAANQINHGGSVILVQLENEHPLAWGTSIPNSYFAHLRDKAVSLGIQVPFFFSGLHHDRDPAGDKVSLDDPGRPNPWFSTEFYAMWYDHYGPQPTDAEVVGRRAWKMIAHGGNGYNVYMGYGGTNFGYTNNDEDAASYDYGAAVGQAADLRPLYYSFKRAAWFARSFADVLENSTDATAAEPVSAGNSQIHVTARSGPAGNIAFLDNPANSPQQTTIAYAGANASEGSLQKAEVTLQPGEIMPVVYNTPIAPGLRLGWAPVRIFGVANQATNQSKNQGTNQGAITTLVIYGPPGAPAVLDFMTETRPQILRGGDAFEVTGHGIRLDAKFPDGPPQEYLFAVGIHRVRILATNSRQVDQTWFVDSGATTYVATGPDYAGELHSVGGHLRLDTEHPYDERGAASAPAFLYGTQDAPAELKEITAGKLAPPETSLQLGVWRTASASDPRAPNFDDHGWKEGSDPQQMGADGDLTEDVWYRTAIAVSHSGSYLLQVPRGGDRATIFVDGEREGNLSTAKSGNGKRPAENGLTFPLTLTPGKHSVAIFVATDGRNKLYNYLGPLTDKDVKGLDGPATLRLASDSEAAAAPVNGWRMRGGPGNIPASTAWRQLKASETFTGPQYFATTFSAPVYGATGRHPIWRVTFVGLGHGSIWVNGHNLGRYPEKIPIDGLYIPECWLKASNTLVIYDEDGKTPGQVRIQVEAAASRDLTEYAAR